MAMTVFLQVLLLFVADTVLACSPPVGDVPELTKAESTHHTDSILVGKILEHYVDTRFDYGSGSEVYTALMKVYCIYKGQQRAGLVNISEVGVIPGKCHSTELLKGNEYIVFVDDDNRIDENFPNTEANRNNISMACGLELKYPTGLNADDMSHRCPQPSSEDNCVPLPTESPFVDSRPKLNLTDVHIDHDHEGHDHDDHDHDHEGHDHDHEGHDHDHKGHDHEGHDHDHEGHDHDHKGHDHEGHDHDHEGHDHEGHDHDHEGHDHEGHDHDHEGHDHEGHDHDHEGHDHEGHDHDHEGHDHEGHDHDHEGHDHEGHDHEGHDHEHHENRGPHSHKDHNDHDHHSGDTNAVHGNGACRLQGFALLISSLGLLLLL